MDQIDVLTQLHEGTIDIEEAQRRLEPSPLQTIDKRRLKRSRFVKLKIRLPNESMALNLLFRMLFALPIPLVLVRAVLRVAAKKGLQRKMPDDIDIKTLMRLLKYARHTKVSIISEDARILIKII